jgi:sugar phosphate isomerase/epimerase
MKLSMMSGCILPTVGCSESDIASLCEFTRELGLDAIDFITTHGVDAAAIRRVVDDHGLKTCCHTFWGDIDRPTAAERKAGLETMKRGIEDTVILGADRVMIPPAGRADVDREQSRPWFIAGLLETLPIAQDAGVILTIEDFGFPTSAFIVSDELLLAVEQVPGLKLTFDSGNCVTAGEDAVHMLERIMPYVVHAHVKDWRITDHEEEGFRGLDGQCYASVNLGEGIVDNAGCVRVLAEAGYEGYINLEVGKDGYAASVEYMLAEIDANA